MHGPDPVAPHPPSPRARLADRLLLAGAPMTERLEQEAGGCPTRASSCIGSSARACATFWTPTASTRRRGRRVTRRSGRSSSGRRIRCRVGGAGAVGEDGLHGEGLLHGDWPAPSFDPPSHGFYLNPTVHGRFGLGRGCSSGGQPERAGPWPGEFAKIWPLPGSRHSGRTDCDLLGPRALTESHRC